MLAACLLLSVATAQVTPLQARGNAVPAFEEDEPSSTGSSLPTAFAQCAGGAPNDDICDDGNVLATCLTNELNDNEIWDASFDLSDATVEDGEIFNYAAVFDLQHSTWFYFETGENWGDMSVFVTEQGWVNDGINDVRFTLYSGDKASQICGNTIQWDDLEQKGQGINELLGVEMIDNTYYWLQVDGSPTCGTFTFIRGELGTAQTSIIGEDEFEQCPLATALNDDICAEIGVSIDSEFKNMATIIVPFDTVGASEQEEEPNVDDDATVWFMFETEDWTEVDITVYDATKGKEVLLELYEGDKRSKICKSSGDIRFDRLSEEPVFEGQSLYMQTLQPDTWYWLKVTGDEACGELEFKRKEN